MGVSDCENFRFEYRVVITLLGCAEFIMLVWIQLSTYWVLRVTSWCPLILTAVVPVGVLLCEVAVFCYDEFGSGGVPVVE